MTPSTGSLDCRTCGRAIAASGPAVALAGANGLAGPAFLPFVDQAATLGTAGLVHLACFISDHGDRALAELLHAPKARAMARP